MDELLESAAARAARYLAEIQERAGRAVGGGGRPARQCCASRCPTARARPSDVLALLDELGSPATMAMAGPRFFGFVIGGALPAALAANWLADGVGSERRLRHRRRPRPRVLEAVALALAARPASACRAAAAGAFVTGATMANFTALAAARHAVLARAGWDVEADGLFGAPPITVVVGEEAHPTLIKALGLLGFGRNRARARAGRRAGPHARRRAAAALAGRRSSARRPATSTRARSTRRARSRERTRAAGAWVHVDGAFGLWAAAAPRARAPRRRRRAGRLVGDRRAQVAERAVRQRPRVRARRRARCARAMAVTADYLPTEPAHAQPVRLHARALAPRARRRRLGRAALARPRRASPSWSSATAARRARFAEGLRAARLRGPQRRRAEPGARLVRRRRARRSA